MKIGQEVYVVMPTYGKATVVNIDSENIYVKLFGRTIAFDKVTKVGDSYPNLIEILCENIDEVKQTQKCLI